ncbi:hypothetical protein DO71_4124 [Burkholderia pseudomallei]|nr:hypothetical protein DO71_4124 [Burkholderia pseudomallei]
MGINPYFRRTEFAPNFTIGRVARASIRLTELFFQSRLNRSHETVSARILAAQQPGIDMTKKPATTMAGNGGSLAFQYAHTLVAQRLSGSNQAQSTHGKRTATSGTKQAVAAQTKKSKPLR